MSNLRSWKKGLKEALDLLEFSDFNTGHPICLRCGNTMNFHGHDESGDFPLGEGYWECSCGFKITKADL